MDTLTKELSGPVGQYLAGFPARRRLHPFDNALLDLTVRGFCRLVEPTCVVAWSLRKA